MGNEFLKLCFAKKNKETATVKNENHNFMRLVILKRMGVVSCKGLAKSSLAKHAYQYGWTHSSFLKCPVAFPVMRKSGSTDGTFEFQKEQQGRRWGCV